MYTRYLKSKIEQALADTRVVLIIGPRQAGKTTLAKTVNGADRTFLTLDDPTILAAATTDPVGLLRQIDRAVIDEVQRAPELLLAIKAAVDADPRPGRFLLTGSANVMALPTVADSLAGRMESLALLPLARAEIEGHRTPFLDRLLAGDPPTVGPLRLGDALVASVLTGGYPEAVARSDPGRRQAWYRNYTDAILQRDVADVAEIEKLTELPRLVRILAEYAGKVANFSTIGNEAGLSHVTTKKFIGILGNQFLVDTLQPWHSNRLKRLTKSPKLHFLDTGLLSTVLGLSAEAAIWNRSLFGPVLESFVYAELRKIAGWSDSAVSLSHFRTRDGVEVDFIVEDASGRLAAIEVKAAASVQPQDFKAMRLLAEAAGPRFRQGVVLYDGDQVLPFGDNLYAAPLSCLWGGPA